MIKNKNGNPSGFNQPFNDLASRLKRQLPKDNMPELQPPPVAPLGAGDEKSDDASTLFANAMAGVKPIARKTILQPKPSIPIQSIPPPTEDKDTMEKLHKLVDRGQGYLVSGTPEYVEGTGYHVHPEISRRLHRGQFSIQAHLDLHGMTLETAQAAFDDFLKHSIRRGYRALLIIHGRGLSSPGNPVLKPMVLQCLTHGHWRKWVIAFSSAKPVDGGAGATYVLLRKNPVTKRHRKKQLRDE